MTFAKYITAMFLLLAVLAALPCAWTQTYKVLYSFTGGEDGAFPQGVIVDSAGNVYGTTPAAGGEGGYYGSVYEISTSGQFTLLHSFGNTEQTPGGSTPFATLARDSSGNLYGTTFYGGSNSSGVVFKLDQNNNYSVLFSFPMPWGSPYDFGPLGSLAIDAQGDLYGAGPGGKYHCNSGSCGMVFKLDPSGNVSVLHSFAQGKNGTYPNAGLIRDAAGNLYGTTTGGGKGGHGLVFKLDSTGKEAVLYGFGKKPDGTNPEFGLVQDAAGNFYGTTDEGGLRGCPDAEGPLSCGVVFKVDPSGNETILYRFTGKADGGNPDGPLVIDSAGNLYGTAGWGTTKSGVIFKVDPAGNETVLYNFAGGAQGLGPQGGLAMDAQGNFYGTTFTGGDLSACNGYGCGVVFKFTP